MCWRAAMMSEDSDYTSDVNFPLQHQHNMSAHQYGGADHDVIDDVSWHRHQHQQQQQPYYQAPHYAGYYGHDAAPQVRDVNAFFTLKKFLLRFNLFKTFLYFCLLLKKR